MAIPATVFRSTAGLTDFGRRTGHFFFFLLVSAYLELQGIMAW
jgi:hypothetical protein